MSRAERPSVTIKFATSLDGKVALASGVSKWITGQESRAAVHELRASHGAVMTGVATLLADDAELTARPGGVRAEIQPLRVVMDTRLRTPAASAFVQAGGGLVIHGPGTDPGPLTAAGARCVEVRLDVVGRADLAECLAVLASEGVASVMIEAGGQLARAAVASGLVDRIEWFRAPRVMGGDGRPCVAALGLESLHDTPMFRRVVVRELGADLWETYERL